jgi:raffinose/stachyose/melibiose transport system permease protein
VCDCRPDLAETLDPGEAFFAYIAFLVDQGAADQALLGSVSMVVPSVLVLLLFGSMAAWVLARRSGLLISLLYSVAISGIVLPPAVITLVLLLRQLSLAGTVPGMVLVYAGIYMSTAILFITGFVRTIPRELEEAARVDGAGPVRNNWHLIFAYVVLMTVPLLIVFTVAQRRIISGITGGAVK